MGTAGNYEISGNYGNSRGIMQPGVAAAHGTVGAVWSGIGVVGMARARNTSLADLHTTQPSSPPSFATLSEFLFGFVLMVLRFARPSRPTFPL